MAKSRPWAERSGEERRTTLGRFGGLYAVIAVITLALGWIPIGVIFALGAIGLFVARARTTDREPEPERTKPDWMLAMDDPDAPDLSLPEYNTPRRDDAGPSPFAAPGPDSPTLREPPEAPPSPEA